MMRRQPGKVILRSRDGNDLCARVGKTFSTCSTNATPGTGNERDLILELCCHGNLRFASGCNTA